MLEEEIASNITEGRPTHSQDEHVCFNVTWGLTTPILIRTLIGWYRPCDFTFSRVRQHACLLHCDRSIFMTTYSRQQKSLPEISAGCTYYNWSDSDVCCFGIDAKIIDNFVAMTRNLHTFLLRFLRLRLVGYTHPTPLPSPTFSPKWRNLTTDFTSQEEGSSHHAATQLVLDQNQQKARTRKESL